MRSDAFLLTLRLVSVEIFPNALPNPLVKLCRRSFHNRREHAAIKTR